MTALISIIILIVCVLLSLIVLVQNPKGGGLASGFTGASQIGGVQRTADFLEKATWTLAIALVVLSLLSTGFTGTGETIDPLDADYDELYETETDPTSITIPPNAEGTPEGEEGSNGEGEEGS